LDIIIYKTNVYRIGREIKLLVLLCCIAATGSVC